MKNRIREFTYENIIGLLRGITIFTFIFDPKRVISQKAKRVFIENRGDQYIHLYLGFDSKGKYFYPLSFIPSGEREVSLERNVLKIIKTVITHNQGQEDEFVETLRSC